jgi:hypothetical protein
MSLNEEADQVELQVTAGFEPHSAVEVARTLRILLFWFITYRISDYFLSLALVLAFLGAITGRLRASNRVAALTTSTH